MFARIRSGLIGLVAALFLVASSAAASDTLTDYRSATRARDINGFALGDHISTVGRAVRLEALMGGEYDGWQDGIEYQFGTTPLGRVYRIGMVQNLGNFIIDSTFVLEMERRSFSKYGRPNNPSRNPWGWQIVELVEDADGDAFAQETNWATASVSRRSDGVKLSITLLDFRILWQDLATLNQSPRTDALDAAQF